MDHNDALEDIEFSLLLEGIYRRYGYDFRSYARPSLKRRVRSFLDHESFDDIGQFMRPCLRDVDLFRRMLPALTVTTSAMFRDPEFYRSLRKNICPLLHTYPRVKIWHAGCSTGEEVYSLAILLEEEGLYDKSTIFASDINPEALKVAREGIYPINKIKDYTSAYQQSGGIDTFSHYYTASYGQVRMNRSLIRNVTFVEHNLATDAVFTEAHLILCRNVFIYFNRNLQEKAVKLFLDSLIYKGLLCLGSTESLRLLSSSFLFDDYDEMHRMYQKNTGTRPRLFRV